MAANSRVLVGAIWFLVLLSASPGLQLAVGSPSDRGEILSASGRIRAVRRRNDADFVLGGLFPVHDNDGGGSRCGPVRKERGVERMEAMLYAIDRINNVPTLLPNITLGFDIRDTCNSENIGLDESIDLVIEDSELDASSCNQISTEFSGSGSTTAAIPTSFVIGAAASAVSVPVATLLRLFQLPQVSYASSSARLNNRERYTYFFRTVPADDL